MEHAYLEYDLTLWAEPADLVNLAARLRVPGTDIVSPKLVCGIRPEPSAAANPARAPRHTLGEAHLWAAGISGMVIAAVATGAALRQVVRSISASTGQGAGQGLNLRPTSHCRNESLFVGSLVVLLILIAHQ